MLPRSKTGSEQKTGIQAEKGVGPMLAMVAVVSVILVSFVVGCLTSSIETEQKLPHRF